MCNSYRVLSVDFMFTYFISRMSWCKLQILEPINLIIIFLLEILLIKFYCILAYP